MISLFFNIHRSAIILIGAKFLQLIDLHSMELWLSLLEISARSTIVNNYWSILLVALTLAQTERQASKQSKNTGVMLECPKTEIKEL